MSTNAKSVQVLLAAENYLRFVIFWCFLENFVYFNKMIQKILPDQQMLLAVGHQDGGREERISTEVRHQIKSEIKAGVAKVALEGWMRVR